MAASRRRTSRRSERRAGKAGRPGREMNRNRHQTISPVDGSVCAEFELASAADIEAALDRATGAQRQWKDVPIGERGAICRRAVERMVSLADQLATELTWQMGR